MGSVHISCVLEREFSVAYEKQTLTEVCRVRLASINRAIDESLVNVYLSLLGIERLYL